MRARKGTMRISVEGNIGCGKSVLLEGLRWELNAEIHPEPVDEWAPLLKLFYAAPRKHALDMQMRVLLDFSRIVDDERLHVIERSPTASHHVFGLMAHNAGWLDDAQWATYKKMAGVLGWEPDAVVYIDVPAEECHARAHARNTDPDTEPADLEYFRAVERMYETLLRFTRVPVRRVDGKQSPRKVVDDAMAAIKELAADRGHSLSE